MDKYKVVISSKAYRDLDDIYSYIKKELLVPNTALKLVEEIEERILSLYLFPYRGVERKTGVYSNKGYRQIIVKNYTIVYRVEESTKRVVIITVKYSPSAFWLKYIC